MRSSRLPRLAVLAVAAWFCFGADGARADQLFLNSVNVIGGSSAFNNQAYYLGDYNAFHVVDSQSGLIYETAATTNYWLGSNY
jgi:thiamine pyrophosphokinase